MKRLKRFAKPAMAVVLIGALFTSTMVFAAPYDPIIGYRNSDDTADTTAHIVNLVPENYAVYGSNYDGSGIPEGYYFNGSNFNIHAAPTPLGINNYQIDLNLSNSNPCDLGNLCDLLDAKSRAYEGTTLRTNVFPIYKDATVASGVAVFNLTDNGLSGGTGLCPNGIIADSINPAVSDATASYQMSWALSNGNKTITVTTNKLTTSNILTGILGQSAANGAIVKLSATCY